MIWSIFIELRNVDIVTQPQILFRRKVVYLGDKSKLVQKESGWVAI